MRRTALMQLFVIFFVAMLSLPAWAGLGDGLTCPPGWSDSSDLGNDLVRQCIAPGQDAFIELYAASGNDIGLTTLLNNWVQTMNGNGMPFHQLLSEQSGHVSGVPALVRAYSGQANNAPFESYLVACHNNGVNYIFQGLYMKSRMQTLKPQVRQSMNTWIFPELENKAETPSASTNPDPSTNTNQAKTTSAGDACCFAYGAWNSTAILGKNHGVSQILYAPGKMVREGREYTWRCLGGKSIELVMPGVYPTDTTQWTLMDGGSLMKGPIIGKNQLYLERTQWDGTYNGYHYKACGR